jgi:NO-binding membrane sensor protein with MHYT domain
MEPVAGEILTPEYRENLVAMSYVISVLGSFAALQCARWMIRPDGRTDWAMVAGAAVSLGGVGIWAMHFIGMLAYRVGVNVSYEVIPTVASLIAAIGLSGLALYLTGGRGKFRVAGWLAGSLLAGLGVAGMHYIGMYAMNMRATMSLDIPTVALSVLIAIGAASAALWMAFNLSRWTYRLIAALVMGVAVCMMHYVGMTAATLICTSAEPTGFLTLRAWRMEFWVVLVSLGVLSYVFWISTSRLVDKALTTASPT